MLEDLTYAYAKPCILDLKVGTRQHADGEPPSKIASKTARCLHTTSAQLGLRLCGMQVYHPQQDLYLFRDKYYGRALDAGGFEQALHDFFHDGERLVDEVVRAFVVRMEKMRRAVLQWTRGRRFYSSSLLLVYEGDRKSRGAGAAAAADTVDALERPSALRQESDSSAAVNGPLNPSPHHVISPDAYLAPSPAALLSPSSSRDVALSSSSTATASGVLRPSLPASLSSSALSTSFQLSTSEAFHLRDDSDVATSSSFSSTSTAAPSPTPASSSAPCAPSASPPPPPPIKLYSHKRKTTHAQAMALARQRGNIDVRIIDFAHTSTVDGDTHGKAEHNRELHDAGLLLGFDHLLLMLNHLLAQQQQQHTQPQGTQQPSAATAHSHPPSSGNSAVGGNPAERAPSAAIAQPPSSAVAQRRPLSEAAGSVGAVEEAALATTGNRS